jgi:probable HAF family extracellular repeat protein
MPLFVSNLRFRECARLILAATILLSYADSGHAVPRYRLTSLGLLNSDDAFSVAHDINNLGEIVGFSQTAGQIPKAFVYQDGAMQHIGTLGGVFSKAFAINDSSDIVGRSVKSVADGGFERGFIYSQGMMNDIGILPGFINSVALDISNGGQVAGYSFNSPSDSRAMLYSNGIRIDLGTLGGAASVATGISDNGVIVGISNPADGHAIDRAFVYNLPGKTPFTLHDLGPADQATPSRAFAVNNHGQIVGDVGNSEAFVYENDTMTGLGFLPGGALSIAYGVNDLGQAVGYTFTGVQNRGFMSYLGKMYDLTERLDADGSGWLVQAAHGNNDRGEIVGEGVGPDGKTYAILLQPHFEGDFDADLDVNEGDLLAWQAEFGGTANFDTDADWDADSDGADFLIWQRQLGSIWPPEISARAVPEPASLSLLLAAIIAVRRRRSSFQ